jgi:hypothetical protein
MGESLRLDMMFGEAFRRMVEVPPLVLLAVL